LLNIIWTGFFLLAALTAAWQVIFLHQAQVVNQMMEALFKTADTAFRISLGLTGVMALWLGLMRIGEAGGVMAVICRWLSPLMQKFFPDIPENHPAFGAMVMNMAANMMGLDNAATPLGLKAMQELQKLNPDKETASNAQIMFLVINTSSVTIIPVTIFTYLYQLNYPNPTELFLPILLATACSSLAGVIAVSIYQRINLLQLPIITFFLVMAAAAALLITGLLAADKETVQNLSLVVANGFILGIVTLFILLATVKRVNVYEEFINGAREGFTIAIGIIPYLVAMLVAISVFRASGAMDLLLGAVEHLVAGICRVLAWFNLAPGPDMPRAFIEALPTGLMKPLSGSGARALMIETIQTHGVDALSSKMAAVMQGSTETTFYVLAVYFGSVNIKKTRHAVPCGLIADVAGIGSAVILTHLFFG